MDNFKLRPLHIIAAEIKSDWKKIYFGAIPYIDAMQQLTSVDDAYGYDNGRHIVNYFLGNAGQWKGETARKIKAELKSML